MGAVDLAYDVFEPDYVDPNALPIVLIHGLFWNKHMFRHIASDMAYKTKTMVYSLDLRNHGESPAPKECDLYLMTEDVKKFMRDKDLKKVNFVCHSFSSTVSYLVLLDQPHTVGKVVMIDNSPFTEFSGEWYKQYIRKQVQIQNRLLNILDPKMTLGDAKAKFQRLAASGNKGQELFYKKAAYDITKINGKFAWKIDLEFIMEKYTNGALWPKSRGSSDHEILLLRSPESMGITDKKFEILHKHNPKAKLVTFENTSHILLFERPETFVEVVKDFFCSNVSDSLKERIV